MIASEGRNVFLNSMIGIKPLLPNFIFEDQLEVE